MKHKSSTRKIALTVEELFLLSVLSDSCHSVGVAYRLYIVGFQSRFRCSSKFPSRLIPHYLLKKECIVPKEEKHSHILHGFTVNLRCYFHVITFSIQVSLSSVQFASAQVGCMSSLTDPHSTQMISPRNHRRLDFAAEAAFAATGATSIWVGCDDADGDGVFQDRLFFAFLFSQINS